MSLLRRHPWILLALLSLVGVIVSLTMLVIACMHPTESVPIDHAAPPPVSP